LTKDPGLTELANTLKKLRTIQKSAEATKESTSSGTKTASTKTKQQTGAQSDESGTETEAKPQNQTTATFEGVEIPVDCGAVWSQAWGPPSPGAPRFRRSAPGAE
jgi:hypothetical protein